MLHILLHVLLRSLLFLKRTRSLTFFIPISHVRYIYGKNGGVSLASTLLLTCVSMQFKDKMLVSNFYTHEPYYSRPVSYTC